MWCSSLFCERVPKTSSKFVFMFILKRPLQKPWRSALFSLTQKYKLHLCKVYELMHVGDHFIMCCYSAVFNENNIRSLCR